MSDPFMPIIDAGTGDMTGVQVTTATASASTKIAGSAIRIKCLTQPCYIRLTGFAATAVTTANGYYMAVGDEVTLVRRKSCQYLAYIRSGGDDGALSIMYGDLP